VALNDPTVRAHLLQSAGLSESDLPAARKPQVFRITERTMCSSSPARMPCQNGDDLTKTTT
jgi:hypothetical protein